MDTAIFVKGLVVGFLVATPVGPIGLLCVQRTLNEGKMHGMVSGLGAATADAVYGLIAALGLTFVSNFLVTAQPWLRLLGGLFLCYLGTKILFSKPGRQAPSANGSRHISNYGSTFFLALTSPATILVFAAVFAGLGVVSPDSYYLSVGLSVAGVFTGSAIWWLMLSGIAGIFHGKVSYDKLTGLNKVSGIIVTAFGLSFLLFLAVRYICGTVH
jgi:threonine/homoserine/homoserine lactone efflux protein